MIGAPSSDGQVIKVLTWVTATYAIWFIFDLRSEPSALTALSALTHPTLVASYHTVVTCTRIADRLGS